ncbi:N-acetylmuramoyl-L-alanine amidase AmiC precursor [Pantoea agglomerans]|uniref:N-acetylmuramoyl-L-alanine amidase AmiC n=1 Tax=Enterobacter agglomerans TaxID=549 RepID=A0A379ABI2_ENTAG|nr:N-acetylmuramoyl-L-alanine amidase AmiC precursor [Pantoea agglomerans]
MSDVNSHFSRRRFLQGTGALLLLSVSRTGLAAKNHIVAGAYLALIDLLAD